MHDRQTESILSSLTARILVGLVLALGLAVAEQFLLDTFAVAARELSFRANGLVGLQDGKNLSRFCDEIVARRRRRKREISKAAKGKHRTKALKLLKQSTTPHQYQ
jgi:hypothetical protein